MLGSYLFGKPIHGANCTCRNNRNHGPIMLESRFMRFLDRELVKQKHSSWAWKKAGTVIGNRTLAVPAEENGENLGVENLQGKEILGGA